MKKTAESASEIEYEANYKSGSSLYQRWFDIGWVELLKRTGKVYYCTRPTDECYKNIMTQGKKRLEELLSTSIASLADDCIEERLPRELKDYNRDLGLAIHLASERLQRSWMLPPMARIKNNTIDIGTGVSRVAADLMCATPPEEISFIIYVGAADPVDLNKFFQHCQELNSTEEYVSLIDIKDIDYRIRMSMDTDGHPRFTNSIISYTEYDYRSKDEAANFENIAKNFIYKMKGMSNDSHQIRIEIRCAEKSAQFIPQTNERYHIKIVPQIQEEWHWSYGRFLALTNDKEIRESAPVIYILLYDITEPLNLDLVLLWLGNNSTYHTKDKKLAAFTPGRSSTSIKEVGNFVK